MAIVVTMELPDEIETRAKEIATRRRLPLNDALLGILDSAISDLAIEEASDTVVLAGCDRQLSESNQRELSALLEGNREGTLSSTDRARLDVVMANYRRGLHLKARAWVEAVKRGLRTQADANGHA